MILTGNSRKQGKEQYYTIPSVAAHFTDVMIKRYGTDLTFLEPCGGRGAFVDALLNSGATVVSYDIEPKHPCVQKQDFLQLGLDRKFITLTNPPFGRACAMAIKFFNHSAKYSDVIGFIVPPSFCKPSIQEQLDDNFHQVYVEDVPSIAFHDDNGKMHEGEFLKTQFHIWERRDYKRVKLQKYRSKFFSFVKKDEFPDLAFRTHGWNAGKILVGLDYNPRTTAFIKLHCNEALQALEEADYSFYLKSTSYIPCLAPAEIALCVDKVMIEKFS